MFVKTGKKQEKPTFTFVFLIKMENMDILYAP